MRMDGTNNYYLAVDKGDNSTDPTKRSVAKIVGAATETGRHQLPSAADCIFLRWAWQRSTHYGRDFALLPKEHFSFHRTAVRTFEAVDRKISANWMWPDYARL
jgi:hypothetical protein